MVRRFAAPCQARAADRLARVVPHRSHSTARLRDLCLVLLSLLSAASPALAQTLTGTVRDQTGGVLPGVTVEARSQVAESKVAVTNTAGEYRLDLPIGSYDVSFSLVNFATVHRAVVVPASGPAPSVDIVLRYVLSADVTVTARRTFSNLADAENPAENLVGIAQSASQGAITARQLEARPIMRGGEILETVPGVVISQHSGEGKANQYYLRGFNLDHGTDFASTVAGMPVNLPTPRTRAGLLGSELPDSGAGERRAVRQGPVLRRAGGLCHGRGREHQLRQRAGPIDGAGRLEAAKGSDASSWLGRRRSRADICWGPWKWSTTTARGCGGRLPESERRAPVQPGRRSERVRRHRHGLSRDMELDRPGAAARDRDGTHRSVRRHRSIPMVATPIDTAVRSSGSDASAHAMTKVVGVRHRVRPEPVLELHLLPRRSRARRSVPPGGPPLRHAAAA